MSGLKPACGGRRRKRAGLKTAPLGTAEARRRDVGRKADAVEQNHDEGEKAA